MKSLSKTHFHRSSFSSDEKKLISAVLKIPGEGHDFDVTHAELFHAHDTDIAFTIIARKHVYDEFYETVLKNAHAITGFDNRDFLLSDLESVEPPEIQTVYEFNDDLWIGVGPPPDKHSDDHALYFYMTDGFVQSDIVRRLERLFSD